MRPRHLRTSTSGSARAARPVALALALGLGGHVIAAAAPGRGSAAPGRGTAANSPAHRAVPAFAFPSNEVSVRALRDADRPGRVSRGTPRKRPPTPAWVRPVPADRTSDFGPRWGRPHRGVDFGAPHGTPIRAVGAGTVVSAGANGSYKLLVVVRHTGATSTAYAHLSRIVVRRGPVAAGQVIGYSGNSGRSTGPHLHFEVRIGGRRVDPVPWLRRHRVRV